jgi:hypothetical protein
VAHEYGVSVYSGGGADSITSKHEMVVRANRRQAQGQETRVLHFGDHDPSGLVSYNSVEFELPGQVDRIAITPEQAQALDAPSSPFKQSPHSGGWTGPTWQMEAIPPDNLRQMVENAILKYHDADARRKVLALERRDRNRLKNWLTRKS